MANAQTDALAALRREQEEFFYAVSHDLQEPVRAMVAITDLLAADCADCAIPEGPELIAHLQRAGERLNAMIQALVWLGRIESRGAAPSACDAAMVCDEALAELGPTIAARGAAVRREPLPRVRADPDQLRWLFTLAIENAIDHGATPEHPARVTITARRAGPRVHFAIRDRGPGIPAERRQEAFALFRRLQRGTGDDAGVGAGLALARRIVRRHGGAIGFAPVESGAELRFDLPADSAPSAAACELRVLHIDDNPSDRRLTEIALQRNGVTVEAAANLAAGIARLERSGIAAVLLDLGLPEGHGLGCLERLRATDDTVPVLVMSGCDDPKCAASARAAGASDYLVKGTVDGAELRAAIVRAIEARA